MITHKAWFDKDFRELKPPVSQPKRFKRVFGGDYQKYGKALLKYWRKLK